MDKKPLPTIFSNHQLEGFEAMLRDGPDEQISAVLLGSEVDRLILNLLNVRKARGESVDEGTIGVVVDWAHQVRVQATSLEAAIAGYIAIDVKDGEVVVNTIEGLNPDERS